ncbi:TetR/AcrR family transcriptional regulator [Plantibacter sp. Mn2098]|uniref:TetR/AcrR family transcriptional regulator n=1 Tax=Plantibacter sp. Mn2098 TaxID=3395266 RepID=UPI003BD12F7D
MDARQRKTRARLATTILELAATRRVSEITVSEIAEQANINRSTFYQHAATPGELLESVLSDELHSLELDLTGIGAEAAAQGITDTTIATIRHIEEHAEVYRVGLSDDAGGSSLQPMLNRRFADAIIQLFDQGTVSIPDTVDLSPEARQLFSRTAANFVAAGAVASIKEWLDTPAPRDIEVFLEVYRELVPYWWPTPAASKAIID